jgi:hypothetical protein
VEDPGLIEPDGRRRLRVAFPIVAVVLAALLAVLTVVQLRNLAQGAGAHVGGGTVDRSGPVLLQSVRDLARYDAAAGSFQVIVDLEQDAGFLPPAIVGQRTLFVAIGSVDAYVDFSKLGDDAVTVSADRRSAQIRLPHAALDRPNLDHQRSHVYSQDRGLVDRVRAFFDQSPNDQAHLYQVAERKIADAATQSGLTDRAEANARTMLRDMLRTLGYQQVSITYA